MVKLKKIIKKLWSNRPFRTFLQGFLGIIIGSNILELDMNGIKTLIVSAIMAGLSAVMSLSKGE